MRSTKNFYLQICKIALISLFIKLNTLNFFPKVDITLKECDHDNKSSYHPSLVGGGAGSGFMAIAILNFTLRLLFDLPFTCRLKCYINFYFLLMFLVYFILLKVFLIVFSYAILIAYLRAKLYRS